MSETVSQEEQARRDELTRRVLNDLQRKRDANPDVHYEVRQRQEDELDIPWQLRFDAKDEVLREHAADAWATARMMADLVSGQMATSVDVWQVRVFTNLAGLETHREESYVVSSCGGSQYWWKPGTLGGGMHQIGSAGFCWTCLQPDYDLDQEPQGLIRHPVTPEELGQPDSRCAVCGVAGDDPARGHKEGAHLVAWGEDLHPRCTACGGGYRIARPDGIGYIAHGKTCPELYPPEQS